MPVGAPTRGNARPLHPRAEGPYRARHRGLPARHHAAGSSTASRARPLWEAGLDFAHGTGHGIGAYLSVHEGPQRIAKPNYPGGGPLEPLRAGMMLSNEPGYYKAGEYGIRIENLVLVEEREIPGGDGADAGVRDADLLPDRAQPDRRRRC